MTIAVQITNQDTGSTARTVLVTTIEYLKGKEGSRPIQTQRVQPGQSATFHIHTLRDLHVSEDSKIGESYE
jgi:hypothetical protein